MGVADIVEKINGGRQIDFSCATSDAYSAGEIILLQDPRTAGQTALAASAAAGICAADKKASDNAVNVGVYIGDVIVDMVASGACKIGAPCINASDFSHGSAFQTAVKEASVGIHSGAQILGYFIEAAASAEQAEFMLSVGYGGKSS